MTILLALLYPIAVQYDRGGRWRLLAPLTLLTIGINLLANYTELALLTWDLPQPGEHTFSQRLKRLVNDRGWRGVLARGIAAGLNYRAHAVELKMETAAEPILFMKPATAVIGPGATIVRPARSAQVDYEAELVLVVDRRCRAVTADQAPAYVAGYTCGNAVTARDLQKLAGQWTRAKSFDTFCPLGPWVVPEAPQPQARVSARLDGVEVQHGLIGEMIVAPLELLSFVSGIMTLLPGDVIMTGTPPGVGPLAAGQTVTVTVEGVGELSNPVV